ncbi:MAG: hypothetical protein AB7I41_20615 [Candidatus Sericytochromatia bacterium]
MQVIITEWALSSYLDLVGQHQFTKEQYRDIIRPDVQRLNDFPNDIAFSQSNFWGPSTDRSGNNVRNGFKMKWHNLGSGNVQLRLSVAILGAQAFLCRAYVKNSDSTDKREAANLKNHIQDIVLRKYQFRGILP